MAGERSYAGAVAESVAQGLMSGAWVAFGELTPGKRRLARGAAVAAVAGIGWATSSRQEAEARAAAPEIDVAGWIGKRDLNAEPVAEEEPDPQAEARAAVARNQAMIKIAMSAAVVGGLVLARRWAEKRWLGRLASKGVAHPHRALGVRVGALTAAAMIPAKVMAVHEARKLP